MDGIVSLTRQLLRIDTRNPGSTEEVAARFVVDWLTRQGARYEVLEAQPGRPTVVSRHPGKDSSRPALVIHGHLDVVPPQVEGWTHGPFSGDVADDCVWGRGAVDMKGFVAMMLNAQADLASGDLVTDRDIVFAYFADEEMGGSLGSNWVVENRPDVFEGASEAIGEVGGFTIDLPDGGRAFTLQVAEKGMAWFRVRAWGQGGHSALSSNVSPLVPLAEMITKLANLSTGTAPPAAMQSLIAELRAMTGGNSESVLDVLGPIGKMAHQASLTTFVPTVVFGGTNANVIPDVAELIVDCRFIPGDFEAALDTVKSALEPGMDLDVIAYSPGLEVPMGDDVPIVAACRQAVSAFDPSARLLPLAVPAGTDAQHLSVLGIDGYGFAPLPLPPDFDYVAMFHGVNERVPISSLLEGQEVLRLLIAGL